MTIIQLKNRFYSIPEKWDELSGRQLIAITRVLMDGPEEFTGKMMLLKILTGMGNWRWMWQSVAELEDHLYLVDFLLIESNLTAQVLPVFPIHHSPLTTHKKQLHGPASNFDNLRIGEFSFCEYYLKEYENKGSENGIFELNQLCGALYRSHKKHYDTKKNPDGDVRETFNKNLCDSYYPNQVKHWPLEVKVAIAYWFKGCRMQLQQDFKPVFSGGGGDPLKYGMWSVMNSVAEKGNHGNFEAVENMLLKEFMMELTESIEKNRKLEQKMKTQ